MAVEIKMPQLGLTMTEGTITKWFKKTGEAVAKGELLFEVSTDKITNQIEAVVAGLVLEIRVPEGKTVAVQSVVAMLGAQGEEAASREGNVDDKQSVETIDDSRVTATGQYGMVTEADVSGFGWIKASPAARKAAREHAIDLGAVKPTGPDSRVVERDVLAVIETRAVERQTGSVKASPLAVKVATEEKVDLGSLEKAGRIMKADVLAVAARTSTGKSAVFQVAAKPLAGIRKVIADRMSRSWNLSPHVHLTVEVDMTQTLLLKDQLAKTTEKKASITEIVIKCAAQVLTEMPIVNAGLVDQQIVFHESVAIGFAVALEDGLIVPVIPRVQEKSLREIRLAVADLSTRAKTGKLLPDEVTGGTFTVTNLGMFGTDHFTPIINPPESAILAVCRTVEKPVVQNGQIVVKPMCNFVLGFDHRLIDGAVGAKFMGRLRDLLENPLLLLVG